MTVIDDKTIPKIPIPDLERRKFFDDGDVSHVRTLSEIQNEVDLSNDSPGMSQMNHLMENILKEIKLTNRYLEYIVGDNIEDC